MFAILEAAITRHRMAVREAEVLVGHFGRRGVEMAEGFADDPSVSAERREHFARVAYHARRRHDCLMSLDTATRYLEVGRMSGNARTLRRGK